MSQTRSPSVEKVWLLTSTVQAIVTIGYNHETFIRVERISSRRRAGSRSQRKITWFYNERFSESGNRLSVPKKLEKELESFYQNILKNRKSLIQVTIPKITSKG